jgi:DNA-binding transcriptional ArsR family regulator
VTSRDLKPLLPGLRRVSSPAALKVLIALLAHADRSGRCHPSWRRLSEATGLSRAAVAKAISRLEAAGLITRTRAPRGRGVGYLITRQGHPGEGSTHGDLEGLRTETRKVSTRRPISEVYAQRPSDGQKPHQSRVPAADPRSGKGLHPDTMEEMKDSLKTITEDPPSAVPPASGPPAFTGASGPEASGLDEPEALFEQLLEEVLNRVPFDPNLGGWMIGTHDLIRVRKYIEDKFPELLEVFRRVARSRMGDRGFDEAWQAAVTNGVGSCAAWHSGDRRWRRIYLFVGETLGLFNAVVEACHALFSPSDGGGPSRQALQAAQPLHEVHR